MWKPEKEKEKKIWQPGGAPVPGQPGLTTRLARSCGLAAALATDLQSSCCCRLGADVLRNGGLSHVIGLT